MIKMRGLMALALSVAVLAGAGRRPQSCVGDARQHDDLGSGAREAQELGHDVEIASMVQVQEHDVGLVGRGEDRQLIGGRSLADHFQSGRGVDQHPQTGQRHLLGADQQDANDFGLTARS